MTSVTSVSVSSLRRALELALGELEQREGPVIELENDYFWWIPADQRFDPYQKPTSFTLGQITECVEHLNAYVDGTSPSEGFPIVWLGQILMGIRASDV